MLSLVVSLTLTSCLSLPPPPLPHSSLVIVLHLCLSHCPSLVASDSLSLPLPLPHSLPWLLLHLSLSCCLSLSLSLTCCLSLHPPLPHSSLLGTKSSVASLSLVFSLSLPLSVSLSPLPHSFPSLLVLHLSLSHCLRLVLSLSHCLRLVASLSLPPPCFSPLSLRVTSAPLELLVLHLSLSLVVSR